MPRNDSIVIREGDPFYEFWKSIKSEKATPEEPAAPSLVERNIRRAYEFDSRISTNGLEDFFYWVNTREAWEETAFALEAIGAIEFLAIFRRIIDTQSDYIQSYFGKDADDMFELSEDYEQLLYDARPERIRQKRFITSNGSLKPTSAPMGYDSEMKLGRLNHVGVATSTSLS